MPWHNGLERTNKKTENIVGMLLSGLGGSYVLEWNRSIMNFIWIMYDNRGMYDILLEGPG